MFDESFSTARSIVFKHPETETTEETAHTSEGDEVTYPTKHLELEDVGKYSKIELTVRGEIDPLFGGFAFFTEKDTGEYSSYAWSTSERRGKFLSRSYPSPYIDDVDLAVRREFLGNIKEIQNELQERGEI